MPHYFKVNAVTSAVLTLLATGLATGAVYAKANTANDKYHQQNHHSENHQQTLLVTATKQSPYAASAQNVAGYTVSESRLAEANIINTQQLSKVLPGVNIGYADSVLFPAVSIRGVSSAQDYYNTAVTLYVDGIPQPSVGFTQPLANVQQVELLKGPQGTLYGKSAEGGIINIVTQQPNEEYRGYISGGYGLRDDYQGKISLSGPLHRACYMAQ